MKQKSPEPSELHMSAVEFDRIMRRALSAPPQATVNPKPRKAKKRKPAKK